MLWTELTPVPFQNGASNIAAALEKVNHVVVASHINPDGDAAGSLAAAGLILRAMGKDFMLYSSTGLPQYLAFFPMPGTIYTDLKRPPFTPQGALLLDCGEPHRLGGELADILPKLAGINVDHHPGDGMGSFANWIMPTAAATTQLMAYVATNAGLQLAGELADAIALGIITDTGGFRHGNTDANVHLLTARLLQNGCNLTRLRDLLENNWTIGHMRLWARLMSRARLARDGSIAFCRVMLQDLRECQSLPEDTEGFAEHLRRLRGVKVAALLREDEPHLYKFSLRSNANTDVRSVAARLGGGGHTNAAGGILQLLPDYAENVLLTAISCQLDKEENPAALSEIQTI